MTDGEMNEIESDVDRMMDKIEAATMNKAILILEMPDRCGHCRLSAMVKYYAMCMVTGLECVENGRPSWCPLREMPERKEASDTMAIMRDAEAANRSTLQQIGYNGGWNDCLDELEGNNDE